MVGKQDRREEQGSDVYWPEKYSHLKYILLIILEILSFHDASYAHL